MDIFMTVLEPDKYKQAILGGGDGYLHTSKTLEQILFLFTVAERNQVPKKRFKPLIPYFRVAFPRKKEIREMASSNPSSEKSIEKEVVASSQAEAPKGKAVAATSAQPKKRVLTADGKAFIFS